MLVRVGVAQRKETRNLAAIKIALPASNGQLLLSWRGRQDPTDACNNVRAIALTDETSSRVDAAKSARTRRPADSA
jgi:hypothetical protein